MYVFVIERPAIVWSRFAGKHATVCDGANCGNSSWVGQRQIVRQHFPLTLMASIAIWTI